MNAVVGSGGGVGRVGTPTCGQAANCARWKKKGLMGLVSRPSNRAPTYIRDSRKIALSNVWFM